MDFSFSRIQALFPIQEIIKKISFKERLILFIALLIFGWSFWCYKTFCRYHYLQALSAEVALLSHQAQKLKKQNEWHQKIQQQRFQANPDYLAQVIEPMTLLDGEKKRASFLAQLFPDNSPLKERLLFLNSNQNQIHFEDLCFSHRIQMNASDLRRVLEALETDRYNSTRGKPFFLMKKFDLIKCYEKGDEKVYSVQVELEK